MFNVGVIIWFMSRLVLTLQNRSNIIIILADDLGWNDVSFHGSNQIFTPNLDALAYSGIIFLNHYVQPTDSGTRASLLTGKYPVQLGLQGPSFEAGDLRGLPENVTIMPQYFKNLGYSTYLVGKWNLGYSKWNDTPLNKGFDHHFGFYNDHVGYYSYVASFTVNDTEYYGMDLRKDGDVNFENVGKYATSSFTDYAEEVFENHDKSKPLFMLISHLAVHSGNIGQKLEAPPESINKFKYIVDPNRRAYAGMVWELDQSTGRLIEALNKYQMLHNTIIVFLSDNGAPINGANKNWGSNYPFRGSQGSLFEGGLRTTAFIYSPLFRNVPRISYDLIHISDWLPTLYRAANRNSGDFYEIDNDMDGFDHWLSLEFSLSSPRDNVLLNIDENSKYAAIRTQNWKLIVGRPETSEQCDLSETTGNENFKSIEYDINAVVNSRVGIALQKNYKNINEKKALSIRNKTLIQCMDLKERTNPCDRQGKLLLLYDIQNDPCEEYNLENITKYKLQEMKKVLVVHRSKISRQLELEHDLEGADPKHTHFIWTPWLMN